MSVEEVAAELYGLAPEDFTATRNARAKEAKAAGDTELAAAVQRLRKPTTAAWLLNLLVRRHGDEVEQVLALGAQLRAAQGTLSGDDLRALDRQRRQLTHAVSEQARALGREAGRRVSEQAAAEVEETLRAAMVDETAGAALSTGLLTDTFSSTGLDAVDLTGLVALPVGGTAAPSAAASDDAVDDDGASASRRRRDAKQEKEAAARERELASATRALEEVRATLTASRDAAAQARDHAERMGEDLRALTAEREDLRKRLRDVDAQVGAVTGEVEAATRVVEETSEEESAAAEAVEAARARADDLRPR
jgi:hypothetical protein